MYSFLLVDSFVSLHVTERETGRDSKNAPLVFHLCGPWQKKIEFSSCVKRNISNADSLQRVAEKSVPIYFWFWQRKM